MYGLVDWDNIDEIERRQGARYIADRLWAGLKTLVPHLVNGVPRLDLRLYGGWYGWNGPRNRTPVAGQLIADIQNDFPFILRDTATSSSVTISSELAESLLCFPKHVLPHTFRQGQGPPRMSCSDPTRLGCTTPTCPMTVVRQFLLLGKCPEPTCTRTVEQFLTRSEQKLVDTMLVADLIHLASSGEKVIAVVSSDDDLWPGMLMAMSAGLQVVHVCTKHHSNPALYRGPVRAQYTQGRL
jgi:hypothetical protein